MTTEASTTLPDNTMTFDPDAMRMPQTFDTDVRKMLTRIRVGKPGDNFIRVDPRSEWSRVVPLLLDNDDMKDEFYLVDPGFYAKETGELTDLRVRPALIVVCYTLAGDLFVWPAWVPIQDAPGYDWAVSRLEVIEEAKTRWLRVKANTKTGSYEYGLPIVQKDSPTLTERSFNEILHTAFKKNYIKDFDHPVMKAKRGA